jgi:hypothetical protein
MNTTLSEHIADYEASVALRNRLTIMEKGLRRASNSTKRREF